MNGRSFFGAWEGWDSLDFLWYTSSGRYVLWCGKGRYLMAKKSERGKKEKKTTFVLELPLVVEEGSAKRVRAHLEAARQLYNAILSEGQRRLRLMRADPAWQAARAIPHAQKQERQAAFSALREQYGFSEYALHAFAKTARVSWLAEHIEAVLAQTLATQAYQALNRVCVGRAKRRRSKSRGG